MAHVVIRISKMNAYASCVNVWESAEHDLLMLLQFFLCFIVFAMSFAWYSAVYTNMFIKSRDIRGICTHRKRNEYWCELLENETFRTELNRLKKKIINSTIANRRERERRTGFESYFRFYLRFSSLLFSFPLLLSHTLVTWLQPHMICV